MCWPFSPPGASPMHPNAENEEKKQSSERSAWSACMRIRMRGQPCQLVSESSNDRCSFLVVLPQRPGGIHNMMSISHFGPSCQLVAAERLDPYSSQPKWGPAYLHTQRKTKSVQMQSTRKLSVTASASGESAKSFSSVTLYSDIIPSIITNSLSQALVRAVNRRLSR